jgi:hypothetical protein
VAIVVGMVAFGLRLGVAISTGQGPVWDFPYKEEVGGVVIGA